MNDIHQTPTPQPNQSKGDKLLTYFGEFITPDTEHQFRRNTLKTDTVQARIALLVSQMMVVPLVWNDYLLIGIGPTFWQTLTVRIGIITISIAIWFLLATDSLKVWDRCLFVWCVAYACFSVNINSTRPTGYLGPVIANVLVLLAIYLLLPLKLKFQLPLASIVTIGQFVYSFWLRPLDSLPLRNSFLIAFVSANLIGFFSSRQLSHRKRLQFVFQQRLLESETHYRTLVDASGSLVWTMRSDLTVDFVNKPWIEITGNAESEIQFEDWLAIIHPDDLDAFKGRVIEQFKRGETTESIVRCLSKSGEYRWVLSRMVPVRNDAGVTEKWIGTSTDIHEAWLTKLELHETNERLENALGRVTQLEEILSICSLCEKIRDENDTWLPLDRYISQHSETQFSHGICPSCALEHYGEFAKDLFEEK